MSDARGTAEVAHADPMPLSLLGSEEGGRRLKVLVVDGEGSRAAAFQEAFATHGHSAQGVTSLREAQEELHRGAPDVAILAARLPDGEGATLLRPLRAAQPPCVCLMTCGSATPEEVLGWIQDGASAHVADPVSPELLLALCARALREQVLLRSEALLEHRTRELHARERRYRDLFEKHSAVKLLIDPEDGRIVEANAAAVAFYGWDRDTLCGMRIGEINTLGPVKVVEAMARALGQEGGPLAFRHRRADGSVRDVTVFASPMTSDGKVLLHSIVLDVTEQRRAERELRRFKDIADQALSGLAVTDLEGRLEYANDYYAAVHGWKVEELIGAPLACFHAPDQMPEVSRWLRHLMARGRFGPVEVPHRHRDGHVFSMLMSGLLLRDEGGHPTHMAASAVDLSERVAAEAALRAQEQQHLMLLEHMPMGIVSHGPDSGVRYANREAQRLLGMDLATMQGLQAGDPTWHFLDEDGQRMEVAQYPISRLLAGEGPFVGQVGGISRSDLDTPIWVLVHGFPVRDEAGRLLQGVVSFQDITPQRRGELERDRLRAQLAQVQKLESMGQLAGGVAHDFNNLLQVILTHVEVARGGLASGPARMSLDEIEKAGRRAADLTRQMLAFSRQQPLVPVVLDLNVAIASLLRLLTRLLGEGLRVVWQPQEGLWPVKADAAQVDQILMNLCLNARDAIQERWAGGGGTLRIRTGHRVLEAPCCGKQEACGPGQFVAIQVEDDGCGMPPEVAARIFEPFFTTKERGRGTGLGLSVVYGAVRQHGGCIGVESDPEGGTLFTVLLPRHGEGEVMPEEAPAEEPAGVPGGEAVLVVDDDELVRQTFVMLLESRGYQVLEAEGAEAALVLMAEHPGPVDLVLTDVVMPEVGGRELGRRLALRWPSTRLLFMSGYPADLLVRQGLLEEGQAFLRKPFSAQALDEAIRVCLET